ncbi:glycosyltransferase [Terribacillus saccharophilus]|uniref:glycosyltransferase n=1 Tax=Terribacillus saccharophilus TaxID=361277 RepID=UPI003981DCB1
MNILHVSSITNNKASGISNVVPLHVKYQSEIANVALLNCTSYKPIINSENNLQIYNLAEDCNNKSIADLPFPYNKPDLVVFHGVYFPVYSRLTRYLKDNNIPYILVPHGSLTKPAREKKKLKKIVGSLLIFNRFIKNAMAIQYLSNEELENSSPKSSRSFIGSNGMNVNSVKKEILSDIGLNLVYIGRLDPFHKGLDILIEACSNIHKEMKEFRIKLNIYGPDHEGGASKVIELINKFNVKDVVIINDGIFGEEKIKILSNSDVFVQTSRFEGQPIGIMEALSFGVPVIATPGTNMADDIDNKKCGWKADLNATDIGSTIIKAYNQKHLLKDMSLNARKFIKSKYDWNLVAKDTIYKYKELLGR